MGLRRDSVGDFGPAIPCVHAIKSAKAVQQPVAVTILDEDALRPGHDPVRHVAAGKFGKVGRRVEKALAIPLIQLVVPKHVSASLSALFA